MTQRHRLFLILLLLLALTTQGAAAPTHEAPGGPQTMPDDLMSAVLAASAQPFSASAHGYQAHSGGLEVSLCDDGLHAQAEGIAWSLSLLSYGHGEPVVPVQAAEIAQTEGHLEYRRGAITEWYRDTALGIEQGLSLDQVPGESGPLVLRFDLTTELVGRLDEDGRGLSFAAPDGRALRYDHLRAWDANGLALGAHLLYAPGKIRLEVDDGGATYPITIALLIYRETKIIASGAAGDFFGYSVAMSGETALVGAYRGDGVGVNPNQGSAYVFIRSGTTWTLQQRLTASDGSKDDEFGFSVALSTDTALVGAPYDSVDGKVLQGSAYVFVRSGITWTQQAHLLASDGAMQDEFGTSVALSGDTALVGATSDSFGSGFFQGSAYVFVRSGSIWTQQAHLTASDATPGDEFGSFVALSGDTALIGAYRDWVGTNSYQGSAYVFVRNGTNWSQQAHLTASDGAASDYFGASVAISGDTALIGASDDDVGANADQGSVYVFSRSGAVWTEKQRLIASDGATSDYFGRSVALSGTTAFIGANGDDVGANPNQGSAYVFAQSGGTFIQQAKLTAADGASMVYFGTSVALSGNTLLAGAYLDDIGANSNQGSAYVLSGSDGAWMQQAKLSGSDGAPSDHFGYSVAISDDTALVGVYSDDIGANADQGSAYVYRRSGTTWTMEQKLTASDGAAYDGFGWSVAVSGNTALVGVPYKNLGSEIQQGAAFVFTRSGSTWTQQAKLTAADGLMADFFGYSVALSGDTALVGAYQNDADRITDKGAAYIYTRSGTAWTQQQKLTAWDGAAGDRFGTSVALSGTTALVGAFFDTVGANGMQGSAYVFVWTGAMWAPQQKLTAADGAANDLFGRSVALSDQTALIGAHGHAIGANAFQGSAYVFTRSGTTWTQQGRLTGADGAANDSFGWSVALAGDKAVIAAPYDDVGPNVDQGSAYFFTRSGNAWRQQAKWTASDGAAGDYYGVSVAVSANTGLVGAYYDDVGANADQGSGYFYDIFYGSYLPSVRQGAP